MTEKLGLLVHESQFSLKQVQENIVPLIILCNLWLNEVHMFVSSCTSSCTKWNMLWEDAAMQQYFAISSCIGWKVIREK